MPFIALQGSDKLRSAVYPEVRCSEIVRVAVTSTFILSLLAGGLPASAQNRIFPSPDQRLRAVIIPVGKTGFETQESRIEIRDARGRLLRWRSFASADGEHGRGVRRAAWTADGQFFVFNADSSGGHQPWNLPVFFYSRGENRFYSLDDFVGPITSDFALAGRNTVVTTRFNFEKNEEKEAIRVRLHNLRGRPSRAGRT